jgi:hypothetical protein
MRCATRDGAGPPVVLSRRPAPEGDARRVSSRPAGVRSPVEPQPPPRVVSEPGRAAMQEGKGRRGKGRTTTVGQGHAGPTSRRLRRWRAGALPRPPRTLKTRSATRSSRAHRSRSRHSPSHPLSPPPTRAPRSSPRWSPVSQRRAQPQSAMRRHPREGQPRIALPSRSQGRGRGAPWRVCRERTLPRRSAPLRRSQRR